jgi:CxxC motif-containing protein
MSDQIDNNKFICIMCPLGCEVTVKADASGAIKEVIGNRCKKGEQYAKDESTRPMRTLTSTVAIDGARISRLPVRTSGLIPKEKIYDVIKEIALIKAKAPAKVNDVLIKNVLGLGVDIISTRDLS